MALETKIPEEKGIEQHIKELLQSMQLTGIDLTGANKLPLEVIRQNLLTYQKLTEAEKENFKDFLKKIRNLDFKKLLTPSQLEVYQWLDRPQKENFVKEFTDNCIEQMLTASNIPDDEPRVYDKYTRAEIGILWHNCLENEARIGNLELVKQLAIFRCS